MGTYLRMVSSTLLLKYRMDGKNDVSVRGRGDGRGNTQVLFAYSGLY